MKTRDSKIIDEFGGTTAVAQLCEISPQAVSKWRKYGIPDSRIKYLKLLKPHIFIECELKKDAA